VRLVVRLVAAFVGGALIGVAAAAGGHYWFTRDSKNPYQALSEKGVAFAREEPSGQCTTWTVNQDKQNRVFACYYHDGKEGVRRGHVRAAVIYQDLTTFEKGAAQQEVEGRFAANAFADDSCIYRFQADGDPVERGDSVLYRVTYSYKDKGTDDDGVCGA
jgi:hypothetical protein